MKKNEFFKTYGGGLYKVAEDNAEYGEYLILHPEEIALAKELEEQGYTIVSVHETENEDDFVEFETPFDSGTQPYKYGYYAIENRNTNLL